MFDASYFKAGFTDHLAAAGSKATVEVHLLNAHTHRVRSLIDATPGYVAFEAYRQRVDGGRIDQYWQSKSTADEGAGEVVRIVVPYESIAEIVITSADDSNASRIGFARE